MSDGRDNRDLLAKTINAEKALRLKDFLAPYTEGSTTAVTKIMGMNYRFRILGFSGSGFGIFHPVDPTCARFVREAEFEQAHEYLQMLPSLHLVLVSQTNLGWSGYPFNLESAKHKGVDCQVIIRNVSDVDRFDVVTVRMDGRNFWYEGPFVGGDPAKADSLRECFSQREDPFKMKSALKKVEGITPEEKTSFDLALGSWKAFKKQTTEGRIKEFLARGGAELDTFVIRGDQIELVWQARSGRYYKSRVDKESLDVVSAGICLDNQDGRFHVKDLPGIINEGEAGNLIYVTERVVDNPRHMDVE